MNLIAFILALILTYSLSLYRFHRVRQMSNKDVNGAKANSVQTDEIAREEKKTLPPKNITSLRCLWH